MIRRLSPLLLAAVVAGCASGALAPDSGNPGPVEVDLLVVPPNGSAFPAQIISGLQQSDVGDGEYDIHLDAGSDFTVRVRHVDDLPIDGASVRFHMRGGAGHDVVAVTDPTGNVTLPLGAAIYDVEVDPDPDTYPNLPPRYFPAIAVLPGGADQEATLVLEPGFRIRGTLRDAQGATLQQWQVSARMQGNEALRSTAATTSMIGAFEIFVPVAGTWVLQMAPPAFAEGQPVATHTMVVDADIDAYTFDFPPIDSHVVTGTVKGIGDLTTNFANITVRARAPQLLIDQPVPGAVISFNGSTTTDAAGFFTLPVLNGSYTLSIEPPAGFEYSHLVLPSVEVTGDVAMVESLTTLYPKVTVSGTAVESLSLAGTSGARVRLSSADGSTSYQFSDPDGTNGDGTFQILANVGSYSAEVLPTPSSGLVRASQQVTVASAITDLSLGLSLGQIVHGKIYDPFGDPVELVTVVALDPSSHEPVGSDENVSDADGSWSLTLPYLQGPAISAP